MCQSRKLPLPFHLFNIAHAAFHSGQSSGHDALQRGKLPRTTHGFPPPAHHVEGSPLVGRIADTRTIHYTLISHTHNLMDPNGLFPQAVPTHTLFRFAFLLLSLFIDPPWLASAERCMCCSNLERCEPSPSPTRLDLYYRRTCCTRDRLRRSSELRLSMHEHGQGYRPTRGGRKAHPALDGDSQES